MSKLGLALVSLIAAIPGGFLTYLLVMTFINNADKLTGPMWAITVPTLLSTVLLAVMPVGVMLFGPKSDSSAADEAVAADDELGDDDDSTALDESEADVAGFDDDDDLMADDGDELSMDDDFDDDASETISADDEDLFMEDDDLGLEVEDDDDEFA